MIYSFICDINSISGRSPDGGAVTLLQLWVNSWTHPRPTNPESKLRLQSVARKHGRLSFLFVRRFVFPSFLFWLRCCGSSRKIAAQISSRHARKVQGCGLGREERSCSNLLPSFQFTVKVSLIFLTEISSDVDLFRKSHRDQNSSF